MAASEGSEGERHVELKRGQARVQPDDFPENGVKTSKYTACNFLPKNIWEQLQKFGNCYFLVISVIMYLGEKTPLFVGTIRAFSTLGLLVMMMAVTAAMALYDDLQRKRADHEINTSTAKIVSKGGKEADIQFQEIRVGHVLVVRKDEEFAADAVPIYCSGEDGNCYVSTANLDGETNLKLKTAKPETQLMLQGQGEEPIRKIANLSVTIGAESPNGNIHDFNGNMTVQGKAVSLGPQQLLMRGTVLRNTKCCLGVVIYTGPDTRMVRNSRPPPMKQSNLEVTTNQSMKYILCIQAIIALTSAVSHVLYKPRHHWYLEEEHTTLPELLAWWLTFFTLYSNLMPISLYPTVEFCNVFQCRSIQQDKKMMYEAEGFNDGKVFAATTRSSNLCQELGQVGYIFSDKTGTLTQNDMALRRVSISGQRFGTFQNTKAQKLDDAMTDGFDGGRELQAARATPSKQRDIDAFLEVLAVSHTVMVTDKEGGGLNYEAESPDEFALVKAAASQGWEFKGRRGQDLTVSYYSPSQPRQDLQYRVLATNAFNSARKRMSVVVQRGSEHLLLVKGADNVMLERASAPHKPLEADLTEFSEQGLRTLVLGSRTLQPTEVSRWLARYDEAQRATTDRDKKLEQVAEEIEKDLKILGATAIEDKLQDGVPETIENIRRAGIKLWVLTGDKLETARNIGFSTRVLTSQMDIQILDINSDADDIAIKLDGLQHRWGALEESSEEEEDEEPYWPKTGWLQSDEAAKETADISHRALMVTGKAMTEIWERDLKDMFKRVSTSCAVLIACRVSPSQKAELVQFIRDGVKPTPVTLAIGDGANDVPMIQTAQVGIGIAGREGRQAVNNSDFAIGQFRYLERLLLLHGRWNYRRACMFTLFTFWRNMVQVLMIVCYTFISGFSGTSIYEDWIRLTFNALCTIPILPPGCLDKDLSEKAVLSRPSLYQVGPQSRDLNPGKTALTLLVALLHALVLLLVTVFAFPGLEAIGAGDYYTFGTICYTCLIIDVNYRATFLTHSCEVRWKTFWTAMLSFGMYICWLLFYPSSKFVTDLLTPNMYMVPEHMVKGNAYFFIMIFVIPLTVLVYDMFFHWFFHRCLRPDLSDKVMREMEEERCNGDSCFATDDEDASESESQKLVMFSDCENESQDEARLGTSCRRLLRQPYHLKVSIGGFLGGLILLLFAWLCHWKSEGYAQLRINYSAWNDKRIGEASFLERFFLHYPVGTREEEVFSVDLEKDCTPQPENGRMIRRCSITIAPKYPLRQPMLFYSVGPMYQNYNHYMKSEVIKELYGKWDEDEDPSGLQSLREAKCPERAREFVPSPGAKPLQLVPCGLKAMSFFNDTFEVQDHHIDPKGIAWRSDVARYNNPRFSGAEWDPKKAELHDNDVRWLFQTYNGVIDPDRNVKDESFVSWMRPSALPRVWNKVGFIHEDLPAGKDITVTITSRWDSESIPGGYKSLVFTEYGEFGTRHDGFARVLLCCGIVSCSMAAAVWPLKWFWIDNKHDGELTD